MTIRTVAIYVPSLAAGGAERVAALLASGFHAAGLGTTLLVDNEAEANRPFLATGVEVVVLGASHARSVFGLARWLARRRPDVALAVDAVASLKLVAARRLCRTPIRTVISYHGFSDIVRGSLGLVAYRMAYLLSRLSDRTVCVSDALSRHLVKDWHALASRVVTAANPVPVDRTLPAADERTLLARPPTILAVGRLVPEKGFGSLVAALRQLSSGVRVEILGDGPDRAALERMIAEAGLADRVTLRGYQTQPWAAYGAVRAFALTSTSESFSNVVVEALAAGLPVVSTDCGGPREILADGRYGALVPVGDVDALAGALHAALEAPGDPAPRVRRAALFSVEQAVYTYLTIFRGIVAA